MGRIDIVRLRKEAGLNQRQLAEILEIRPSFLSAIETGRSRLPDDKYEKLCTAFGVDSLEDYTMEDPQESIVPPHTHVLDQGDTLTQLLNHFHALAHQQLSGSSAETDEETKEHIRNLTLRNDRLSDRLDDLREEVDALRKENHHLKELLIKNGLSVE